jgi:serine/threonine protein kinase
MIKILFLASNPRESVMLDLRKEANKIRRSLRLADLGHHFDFKAAWGVTSEALTRHLLNHKPDVVHFSGHANHLGSIILDDERGEARPLPPRALTKLFEALGSEQRIQCVVLNACFTATQARGILESVPCVAGMSREIDDSSAIAFAVGFYQGIGSGRSVETAFKVGRATIQASEQAQERDFDTSSPSSSGAATVGGEDASIPELLVRDEIDPRNFFISGVSPKPDPGDQPPVKRRNSSRTPASATSSNLLHSKYLIKKSLGSGIIAKVELAFDTDLERYVVIKTLLERAAKDYFDQEVREIAKLGRHPNLVSIYGSWLHEENPHYVRQFVEGHSLRDELAFQGKRRLPIDFVHQTLSALGDAMYVAQDIGVWNLGVRPEKVLIQRMDPRLNLGVCTNYNIVICPEIGVCEYVRNTTPDRIRSNPRSVYCPPEFFGDGGLHADDLDLANQYRLGVIGYEMLVGHERFKSEAEQRLRVVAPDQAARLPDWPRIGEAECPLCPAFLFEAINRMIDADPERRFKSLGKAIAAFVHRDMDVETARDSFRRILSDSNTERKFFLALYARLLSGSQGIREIFKRLSYPEVPAPDSQQSVEQQTKWNELFGRLKEAIVLLFAYNLLKEPSEPTILSRIAECHRDYDASYFTIFRNALIDTVVDIDKGNYSGRLRDAWGKAVDPGVKYMAEFARRQGVLGR